MNRIDVFVGYGGVGLLQLGVIVRAQESKGCDKGPGADAGHQLEAGPGARLGPTAQDSRAEGAVTAAAGQGQEVGFGLELAVMGGHLLPDGLNGTLLQAGTVNIASGPDTRQIGNLSLIQEILWQRMLHLQGHAALEGKY